MSEPLDPVTAGLASVLKSLRTRAGLREDRLAATELALDTLTGLESVRELISAGDTAERAVIKAVSAAAGTLEPTHSIVADVSLGLGPAAPPCWKTGTVCMNYDQPRTPARRRPCGPCGWRSKPRPSARSP